MRLVPVLLAGLDDDPKRPWDTGEFSPIDPRQIDSLDATDELARAWKSSFDEEDPESVVPVKPFGFDFPGLASAPALVGEPDDDIEDLARMKPRRIALIAAGRPADAITAVGWMGAVNLHQDPALMSAILRSWEDRWRARVVEIGFDTLTLTVGNPPRDEATSMALRPSTPPSARTTSGRGARRSWRTPRRSSAAGPGVSGGTSKIKGRTRSPTARQRLSHPAAPR